MTARSYKVAGHVFTLESDLDIDEGLQNYAPFAVPAGSDAPAVFTLEIVAKAPQVEYTEEARQDEEGQQIICGRTAGNQSVFEFRLAHKLAGTLVCEEGYKRSSLYLTDFAQRFGINNALMVLYALATAPLGTALFHSAVVEHDGYGYMFLGKSGTGKSTHSQLWLKYIDGTELVNDDNPVVRIIDGEARVYGSPWSGKTPCYRKVDYLIGGIVKLKQAPANSIRRMEAIEAYVALTMSISGMRWKKWMGDGLHETENQLTASVPVWHLSCLPDQNAAELCHSTIAIQD